jgi:hypothetical protein
VKHTNLALRKRGLAGATQTPPFEGIILQFDANSL